MDGSGFCPTGTIGILNISQNKKTVPSIIYVHIKNVTPLAVRELNGNKHTIIYTYKRSHLWHEWCDWKKYFSASYIELIIVKKFLSKSCVKVYFDHVQKENGQHMSTRWQCGHGYGRRHRWKYPTRGRKHGKKMFRFTV